MGHLIKKIDDCNVWLSQRTKGIGGSDAASILGYNPYKSSIDLWREKTGRTTKEDISNKPAVKYGKEAEEHLRNLFILDYPQYNLFYSPYDILINEKYNFIQGTLDGLLTDSNGNNGFLEVKTTEIINPNDWKKWDNKIPMNYFCQVLHYFALDEDFKFCYLKAKIKYHKQDDPELYATIRHYYILREKYLQDIDYLVNKEKEFWRYIEQDKEPPLILPTI